MGKATFNLQDFYNGKIDDQEADLPVVPQVNEKVSGTIKINVKKTESDSMMSKENIV
jgi:hypothetical protein